MGGAGDVDWWSLRRAVRELRRAYALLAMSWVGFTVLSFLTFHIPMWRENFLAVSAVIGVASIAVALFVGFFAAFMLSVDKVGLLGKFLDFLSWYVWFLVAVASIVMALMFLAPKPWVSWVWGAAYPVLVSSVSVPFAVTTADIGRKAKSRSAMVGAYLTVVPVVAIIGGLLVYMGLGNTKIRR